MGVGGKSEDTLRALKIMQVLRVRISSVGLVMLGFLLMVCALEVRGSTSRAALLVFKVLGGSFWGRAVLWTEVSSPHEHFTMLQAGPDTEPRTPRV